MNSPEAIVKLADLPAALHPDAPFPDTLDNTTVSTFMACQRKAQNSFFHKLAPTGTSTHLNAGGAIAKGVEIVRRSYYQHGRSAQASLADGLWALSKAYGSYDPPTGNPKLEAKDWSHCMLALSAYFSHYPLEKEDLKPLVTAAGAAVEFTFALPLPILHPTTNEPILYTGRFDMVGVRNSLIWAVDEKTCGSMGPTWGNQWSLRSQFLGYTWALHQSGLKAAGAIVRGICLQKTQFKFAEMQVMYPDFLIRRWHDQLLRNITAMISAWKSGHFAYALGDACTSYGGCEFTTLCQSDNPADWLHHYQRRDWNPLTKDGDEA